MSTCPCCGSTLIRQIGDHRETWFCRNCWQIMPVIERDPPPRDPPKPDRSPTPLVE